MPPPAAVIQPPNAPSAVPATSPPAAPVVAAKAPVPAEEAVFEVKVGGEVRKYKRSEAERLLSKAGFADTSIRQAKDALKAAAELKAKMAEQDSIWDDDERLEAELEKRGKLDTLARKRLAQKISEQEMTPEQRRIAELEAKQADSDKKLKAVDDEKAQRRLSDAAKVKQTQIENELDAAWERAGFERGADSFYAVYEVMQEFVGLGLLDPKEQFSPGMADRIIDTARENMEGTDKRREAAVLKGLKGRALVERLGKGVVDEVLRWKVEELRGGGAKKTNGVAPPKPPEPTQWVSPQEALKKMRGSR